MKKNLKKSINGVPPFKLYEQYQMIDAALLSNYRKIYSSFRGTGLLRNNKEYFCLLIFIRKNTQKKV